MPLATVTLPANRQPSGPTVTLPALRANRLTANRQPNRPHLKMEAPPPPPPVRVPLHSNCPLRALGSAFPFVTVRNRDNTTEVIDAYHFDAAQTFVAQHCTAVTGKTQTPMGPAYLVQLPRGFGLRPYVQEFEVYEPFAKHIPQELLAEYDDEPQTQEREFAHISEVSTVAFTRPEAASAVPPEAFKRPEADRRALIASAVRDFPPEAESWEQSRAGSDFRAYEDGSAVVVHDRVPKERFFHTPLWPLVSRGPAMLTPTAAAAMTSYLESPTELNLMVLYSLIGPFTL